MRWVQLRAIFGKPAKGTQHFESNNEVCNFNQVSMTFSWIHLGKILSCYGLIADTYDCQ